MSAHKIARLLDDVSMVEYRYVWGRRDLCIHKFASSNLMMQVMFFWNGTRTYNYVRIVVPAKYTSPKGIAISKVYSVQEDLGCRDKVGMVAQAMPSAPLRTSMLHVEAPEELLIWRDSDLFHAQSFAPHPPHLGVLENELLRCTENVQ